MKMWCMIIVLPLLVLAGIYAGLYFSFDILVVYLSRDDIAIVVRKCSVASKSVYTLIPLKPHVGRDPGHITTMWNLV